MKSSLAQCEAPSWLRIMACFSVAAMATASKMTSRAHGVSHTLEPSAAKVRDALRNLLSSVEQDGRASENFFQTRQNWCKTTLSQCKEQTAAAASSLGELEADLEEREAAVEEAQWTVQQLQADLALVTRTLNKTEGMMLVIDREGEALGSDGVETMERDRRALQSMLELKQKTKTSIEGQLEVATPALARLRAQVAEMQRRIADRGDTSSAGTVVMDAVKDSCKKSLLRGNAEAAARVQEATLLQSALQALERGAVSRPTQNSLEDDAPSFVQIAAHDQASNPEDDLMSIFGGSPAEASQHSPGNGASATSLVQKASPGADSAGEAESNDDFDAVIAPRQEAVADVAQSNEDADAAPVAAEVPVVSAVSDAPSAPVLPVPTRRSVQPKQPQIKDLLEQLRQGADGDGQDAEWCRKQRSESELAARLATESVKRATADMDEHADEEGLLKSSGAGLANLKALLLKAEQELTSQGKREQELITSGLKNRAIATRILTQAGAVIRNLQAKNRIEDTSETIEGELASALGVFNQNAKADEKLSQEAAAVLKVTVNAVESTAQTVQRESSNLEVSRDWHKSQRAQLAQSKLSFVAVANEAEGYLKRLTEECHMSDSNGADWRKAQIHALEDAQNVMMGKPLTKGGTSHGLRGGRLTANMALTPMERAAQEMGVAVE